MKIAFIVSIFPALSETFILNQITGLLDLGHDVDIFSNVTPNEDKVHSDFTSYRLIERTHYFDIPDKKIDRVIKAIKILLIWFFRYPLVILKALNIIKYRSFYNCLNNLFFVAQFLGKKYDIIHCHFGPNGILGIRLKELGIPGKYITSFHGFDVNSYVKKHGKDVYKNLFEKVDLCTVNTDFTGRKVKALGCEHTKITKLPVGLDIRRFPFKERKIRPENKVNIFTVARLVEVKGVEYSIRAVAKLLKTHSNICYRIAGDGHLREELQGLISRLGAQNKVILLGWKTQDEVQELYEKSHIFVLSSVIASNDDQEGQGLVLVEAQAMGLPIISTLVGGIPEGVLDGKSGFLIPERNVDVLAERLQCLIEHPEVWPEMGRCGRNFVEKHYDINKLNQQLVKIYQNLLRS